MTATAPAIPGQRDRPDDGRDERADASELAPALRVLEVEAREERMAADLRRRPAEREQPNCRPGHGHAHREHDQLELDQPER